jgi:predicted DNA-binding transcriptional regulator AlpA
LATENFNHKEVYPVVLSVKHVAEIMGVAQSTAYEMFKLTDFPALDKLNGNKRVLRDSFFAWLESKQRKGETDGKSLSI